MSSEHYEVYLYKINTRLLLSFSLCDSNSQAMSPLTKPPIPKQLNSHPKRGLAIQKLHLWVMSVFAEALVVTMA